VLAAEGFSASLTKERGGVWGGGSAGLRGKGGNDLYLCMKEDVKS
jgi:hypothetical protein